MSDNRDGVNKSFVAAATARINAFMAEESAANLKNLRAQMAADSLTPEPQHP